MCTRFLPHIVLLQNEVPVPLVLKTAIAFRFLCSDRTAARTSTLFVSLYDKSPRLFNYTTDRVLLLSCSTFIIVELHVSFLQLQKGIWRGTREGKGSDAWSNRRRCREKPVRR